MSTKLGTNQRVLLATLLSAAVFIGYDYFLIPKLETKPRPDANATVHTQAPRASAAVPGATTGKVAAALPAGSKAVLVRVSTPSVDFVIDAKGRISQAELEDKKFEDKEGKKLALFTKGDARPLEIRFSDPALNDAAFKTPYTADRADVSVAQGGHQTVVLEQNLSGTSVHKTVTFDDNGHYRVSIALSQDAKYYLAVGERPSTSSDKMTFHGALVKEGDDTVTTVEDEDAKAEMPFSGAKIAAAVDQYYASILYSPAQKMNVVLMPDGEKNPLAFVEGKKELTLEGYIGPKYVDRLKGLDPELGSVVEYGFFTFIARPIFAGLAYLYNVTANWGWAIVLMTIIIRVILFPLTYKGMVSMTKLKDLAPKLKEIQEKYKGDPQKLNIHMMDLYKKHNVNPLGGCLPMLLQIPIFFAIYRVLLNAIELKGAGWMLWIHDLSVMDPYFVLPILMGASMFVQQKITPSTFSDPLQQKVFLYMPIVFTFFFVSFPAGLTLYWFVSNLLSIAQQYVINKTLHAHRPKGTDDQD